MAKGAEHTVTAAEFVRHFARIREEAARHPVYISSHGRLSHVLLNIDAYHAMRDAVGGRNGGSDHPQGGGGDLLYNLAEWIDEALIVCDPKLNILFANRVALAISRRPAGEVAGKPLFAGVPELTGSLIETHTRHTLVSGEPSSADILSPFSEDSWLRFESFPLADRIVLKFRDITDDVQRHRLADIKSAMLRGIDVHGNIAYVRVSIRGTIDFVSQSFCELLGLPEDRLIGVLLSDLVELSERRGFRDVLEGVLRTGNDVCVPARFLSNRGTRLPAIASVVQLRGAYAAEGAVILLSVGQESQQSDESALRA